MSKEKYRSDIVYALADYKQLVMAYKSKHAELVKKMTFWKVSFLWLLLIAGCGVVGIYFMVLEKKSDVMRNRSTVARLNNKIEEMTDSLGRTQQELKGTQEELTKKQNVILQLEQNISNAPKKLLEKLLIEQEQK